MLHEDSHQIKFMRKIQKNAMKFVFKTKICNINAVTVPLQRRFPNKNVLF